MKNLIRITSILLFFHAGCGAAEPALEIRVLRTDPKTADSLKDTLQDGKTDATQIEDKLDALAKDGTLTELATFKQQSTESGKKLTFEKDSKDIEVADGVVLPGGLSCELVPTFESSGFVDLRLIFKRSVEHSRNKIATETK